jgi:hypothetical protein
MTFVFTSDVGLQIVVPVSASLTGAVKTYLDARTPAGTTVTWTCPTTGYDSSSLYYITTSSASGGLDTSGVWKIAPHIIWGAASSISLHGDPYLLTVYDPV